MAFCGNCGTKAVGEFCVNCGKPTLLNAQPAPAVQPQVTPPVVQPPVVETPVAAPAPTVVEPEVVPEPQLPPAVEPALVEPTVVKPLVVEPPVVEPQVEAIPVVPTAVEPEKPKRTPKPTQEVPLAEPAVAEEALEAEPAPVETAPEAKKSKRVPLLIGAGVLVLGALLFPGSGEIQVLYQDNTSEENAAVDLTLQIDGQDLRIPKDADMELVYTGTWSSFQAAELTVIPDPKNDEAVTITLPQLGSLGIWNINKLRVVTITANDRNLEVNLSGADNFSEVGTVSAYRSFYERDLASCKEDFNDDYGYGINLHRKAYDNYLAQVEDAQLDGTRTLQYTTWASRADNLQSKMTGYLSLVNDNALPTQNPTLVSSGGDVKTALEDLRSAWKNLETVSRNESDSKWDGAWTRIYNAETALFDKVESFTTTAKGVGGKICDAQLNRE